MSRPGLDAVAQPFPVTASGAGEAAGLRQSALQKNAWRLLPVLTLAFVFNYIDRTSVGFAALSMNADLGLTSTEFGWGAGILFFGYCFFELPSNVVLYRVGARRWLARIMISWGLVSALTAFVTGPYTFYGARFLLGVAEAGFFPGVTFLLSAWFPAEYRTRVLAWFLVAVPLSSVIGGPLSVLLLELNGVLGLHGWQWMFLVQGLPACVLGLLVLVIVRDSPHKAHWLTQGERDALVTMLAEEQRDRPTRSIGAALRDPRVLLLAAIQFGFIVGSYGVGIWLPLILKSQGLTNLTIGFVSVVPYAIATAAMLVWAQQVDRTGRKIGNLAAACFVGALGLVFAVVAGSFSLSLLGLTVALVGVTSARAIFWTIPTRFLTGMAAAGGLAFINSVGTFGGFVGPFTIGWLKDLTGSFTAGLLVMTGLGLVAAVLALALKLVVQEE